MNNFDNIFADYMNSYKATSGFKDNLKMEIYLRKAEYEECLNKMYANYMHGCTLQIVAYNEQIGDIKSAGLKVLRNSSGKHKIIIK
ncbi:hypothetical protein DW790_05850 [Firmicutes bacterium AM31-12AC]|nr:hypothetical protein DW790_05850 [Firmicutes bacterium AM31-12AC]